MKFAAETYLEETQYKRVKRVDQQIELEGALASTLKISVDQLQSLPQDRLDYLIDTLESAQVEVAKAKPALNR